MTTGERPRRGLLEGLSGIFHGLLFGGALYLGVVVIFLLSLPFRGWRDDWVRKIVLAVARVVVPVALWVGGIRVDVRGREHLEGYRDGPWLLVSNHCSNLDGLAQIVAMEKIDIAFVTNIETIRRPIVGRLLQLGGWFAVEQENRLSAKRLQEEMRARRKQGWVPQMSIFPEGARSPDGSLMPFHVGPFLVAAMFRMPVIPIVIRGACPIHARAAFRVFPGTLRIDILAPIEVPEGADPFAATAELKRRAEEIFSRIPDLNSVDDVPPVAAAEVVS